MSNYVTTPELKNSLKGRGLHEVTQEDLENFQGRQPCESVRKVVENNGLNWPEAEKQLMTA